jgi:hypothetical protein
MSPVRAISILQSKLSDLSTNRKARISREGTVTTYAQILSARGSAWHLFQFPHEKMNKESALQFFPHGPPAWYCCDDFILGKIQSPPTPQEFLKKL